MSATLLQLMLMVDLGLLREVVGKVRDMARTAWRFASRVAWLDQASGTLSELPAFETVT